jgi:hypothetical protein
MTDGSNANLVSNYMQISFYEALHRLSTKDIEAIEVLDSIRKSDEQKERRPPKTIYVFREPTNPAPLGSYKDFDWKKYNFYSKLCRTVPPIRNKIGSLMADKDVSFTNHLSFQTLSHDNEVVAVYQDAHCRELWPASVEMVVTYNDSVVYSGGSPDGLFNRLDKGLCDTVWKTPRIAIKRTDPNIKSKLSALIPWSNIGPQCSLTPEDLPRSKFRVSLKAGYGLPHPEFKKGDRIIYKHPKTNKILLDEQALVQMYKESQIIMSQFDRPLDQFLVWKNTDEGRSLLTCMLKNKSELMEKADITKKTRPYYVFPAGLGSLFSIYFSAFTSGWELVTEHPTSCVLIGFSWTNGGAEKLLRVFTNLANGENRWAIYGDDLVLGVRLTDGTLYIICPDAQHLDMSLTQYHTSVTAAYTQQVMNPPRKWCALAQLWANLSISGEVIMWKSDYVTKSSGLFSGVPGTSVADTIATAEPVADLEKNQVFKNLDNLAELESAMQIAVAVFSTYNIRLHPDTLTPQLFIHGETVVGPILGQSLYYYAPSDSYLPSSSNHKLLASLSRPGKNLKGIERSKNLVQRIAGLLVSGGYYFDHFYYVAKTLWESTIKRNDIVVTPDETTYGLQHCYDEEAYHLFFDKRGVPRKLPTQKQIRQLYMSESARSRDLDQDATDSKNDLDVPMDNSLRDMLGDLDWGDIDQTVRADAESVGQTEAAPPEFTDNPNAFVLTNVQLINPPVPNATNQLQPQPKKVAAPKKLPKPKQVSTKSSQSTVTKKKYKKKVGNTVAETIEAKEDEDDEAVTEQDEEFNALMHVRWDRKYRELSNYLDENPNDQDAQSQLESLEALMYS